MRDGETAGILVQTELWHPIILDVPSDANAMQLDKLCSRFCISWLILLNSCSPVASFTGNNPKNAVVARVVESGVWEISNYGVGVEVGISKKVGVGVGVGVGISEKLGIGVEVGIFQT